MGCIKSSQQPPTETVSRELDSSALLDLDAPLPPDDALVLTSLKATLQKYTTQYPYLEPGSSQKPYVLQNCVTRCRECLACRAFGDAQEQLRRLAAGITTDLKQVKEAFTRFDADKSGFLDVEECRHMCAYLGWGAEEAEHIMENADVNKDGNVSLEEFQSLVGHAGGVQRLFDRRRQRVAASRRDVCDHTGISIGDRVRAHFYVNKEKSRSWREAQVLKLEAEEPADGDTPARYGVLLEFGFGIAKNVASWNWRARQVVPASWILSGAEDAAVVSALREVGILDDQQGFFSLVFPDSELRAVEKLVPCQRAALAYTRSHCVDSHETAMPKVKERFEKLGFTMQDLQDTLTWIEDLAPIVVHVHLDRMGQFLETDEFYRNQFETKTSCGALDPENNTRKGWEHELFGGTYDNAKAFDRAKYGALNVLNDYRGVVRARGYGDSYLVLKDVRLRCTFASTDSGGLQGKRLGTLDKYAHVLAEYNDEELRAIKGIAVAAHASSDDPDHHPQLLRGPTEDPAMDWVTFGFPDMKQTSGRLYFEVELDIGVTAPQVGILSDKFKLLPKAKSAEGVGDCENGWAVDGMNAALWHKGATRAWKTAWKAEAPKMAYYFYGGGAAAQESLAEKVVVGVGVDLNTRAIWFSSDGKWDKQPDFNDKDIPGRVPLYPAMSLKGRACFNFGPDFKHGLPDLGDGKTAFKAWPCTAKGKVNIDSPVVGNEEILSIYKEVQIHGEVALKKHVQRLVACNKYRDTPKTQRSWALNVSGAGFCSGKYKRVGVHNGLPLYKHENGAIIFCEPQAKQWRLAEQGDKAKYRFTAPVDENIPERPPRDHWNLPDEDRGVVSIEDFGSAVGENGATPGDIAKLSAALTGKDSRGIQCIFRRKAGVSFDVEWKALNTGKTPQTVWDAAVASMQRKILVEFPFAKEGIVVETLHPYEEKAKTWKRPHQIEGANSLAVYFTSKCQTVDSRSCFNIYSSGLRREAAGAGARAEVAVPGGDKIWGTVIERTKDGLWRICMDRHLDAAAPTNEVTPVPDDWPKVGDLVEGKYKTGVWHKATIAEIREDGTYVLDWYDNLNRDREKKKDLLRVPGPKDQKASTKDHRNVEDLPRYGAVPDGPGDCFALCRENPRSVSVKYAADPTEDFKQTVGDEIEFFGLDRTMPLRPIFVEKFASEGPAQEKGVEAGWYLDIVNTICTSKDKMFDILNGIGGLDLSDKSQEPRAMLDACFSNLEDLQKLLNGNLRGAWDVTLTFTDSSSPTPVQLLPSAHVFYAGANKVGDELELEKGDKKVLKVTNLLKAGPAHEAGVRGDWHVNVQETLRVAKVAGKELDLTEESILGDPACLLAKSDLMVVFRQPEPNPVLKYQAFGRFGSDPKCAYDHNHTLEEKVQEDHYCDSCYTTGTKYTCKEGCDYDLCEKCFKKITDMWNPRIVPGDRAEFEFQTDGDTGDAGAEERWGIWSLVIPKRADPPPQADLDALATKWVEATDRAKGCLDDVQIIRNDWDETRLKALCARHGWEFSWMTEDSERKRRATERFDTSLFTAPSAVSVRPLAIDTATPDGHTEIKASRASKIDRAFTSGAAVDDSDGTTVI